MWCGIQKMLACISRSLCSSELCFGDPVSKVAFDRRSSTAALLDSHTRHTNLGVGFFSRTQDVFVKSDKKHLTRCESPGIHLSGQHLLLLVATQPREREACWIGMAASISTSFTLRGGARHTTPPQIRPQQKTNKVWGLSL
ncbi:uncharacterized protein LOC112349919 [Selaginella moellendorffii]|uniref:uncharacterized protein LOC112349919 n=1 Tax=Selaginella moellendorffii TaxID=88036 RepID=UPI000D1CEFB8|nr:uncharacterized protein LOC112349919 [Selaginella moellendorffii]|eukprot:XP_024540953.1 uncharacterized protein LOC112349919 [Selaginella moellendorffii]